MEKMVVTPPGKMETASGLLTESLERYYDGLREHWTSADEGAEAVASLVAWVRSLSDHKKGALILDLLSYQGLVHSHLLEES